MCHTTSAYLPITGHTPSRAPPNLPHDQTRPARPTGHPEDTQAQTNAIRSRHAPIHQQATTPEVNACTDKGWERKGGGGNYIPNVAIGEHNRALIGIDRMCCKSPEGKSTYPVHNRLSSTSNQLSGCLCFWEQ